MPCTAGVYCTVKVALPPAGSAAASGCTLTCAVAWRSRGTRVTVAGTGPMLDSMMGVVYGLPPSRISASPWSTTSVDSLMNWKRLVAERDTWYVLRAPSAVTWHTAVPCRTAAALGSTLACTCMVLSGCSTARAGATAKGAGTSQAMEAGTSPTLRRVRGATDVSFTGTVPKATSSGGSTARRGREAVMGTEKAPCSVVKVMLSE